LQEVLVKRSRTISGDMSFAIDFKMNRTIKAQFTIYAATKPLQRSMYRV